MHRLQEATSSAGAKSRTERSANTWDSRPFWEENRAEVRQLHLQRDALSVSRLGQKKVEAFEIDRNHRPT